METEVVPQPEDEAPSEADFYDPPAELAADSSDNEEAAADDEDDEPDPEAEG